MSFVWGKANVEFLQARFKAMSAHHCYHGMEYSEDRKQIANWAPLIIEGRDDNEPIAATRIVTGTDVDYGSLTHLLVAQLSAQPGFSVHYEQRVVGLEREGDGRWRVRSRMWSGGRSTPSQRNSYSSALAAERFRCWRSRASPRARLRWLPGERDMAALRFAGGVRPPSRQGLRQGGAGIATDVCSAPRHSHYRRQQIAAVRAVCRVFDAISQAWLAHGPLSVDQNQATFFRCWPWRRDNAALSEYLIGQVPQTSAHQFAALQQFFPTAKRHEWQQAVAGQRVQIIKPDKEHTGVLEFGTELIAAEDRSLVALLGASPGASTAAFIAIGVLQKCFPGELTESAWLPKLKQIIPTYGIDLRQDADACRRTRAETAPLLKIENI